METLEVSRYAGLVKKKNVSDKNYLGARNLKKFIEVWEFNHKLAHQIIYKH